MEQASKIECAIEVEESPSTGNIVTLGKHGEMTAEALASRAMKQAGAREFHQYRECVPCDRCGNCLILKGFDNRLKIVTKGMWCNVLKMEVTMDATCNMGYRPKNNLVKAILLMEGAPQTEAAMAAAMAEAEANRGGLRAIGKGAMSKVRAGEVKRSVPLRLAN